jgi:hypothetical protein
MRVVTAAVKNNPVVIVVPLLLSWSQEFVRNNGKCRTEQLRKLGKLLSYYCLDRFNHNRVFIIRHKQKLQGTMASTTTVNM